MLKGTGWLLVSGWLEPVPDLLKQKKKYWVSALVCLGVKAVPDKS
jgi:hypothetical protein